MEEFEEVKVVMEQPDPETKKDEKAAEMQCHTCLSTGRQMIPIGDRAKIFSIIITGLAVDDYSVDETSDLAICIECHEMLLKVDEFRNKVKRAEEVMKFRQMLVCRCHHHLDHTVTHSYGQ